MEDLYVKQDPEGPNKERKCTNSGCGKTYTEATNSAEACLHHPGAPLFHEGRKGWQCCSKRVDDFDEAMALPGCEYGRHATRPPPIKNNAMNNKPVDPQFLPSSSQNGVEAYSIGGRVLPKSPAPTPPPPQQIIEEPDDPLDAVIALGTKCRHHGCKSSWTGEESRTEDCVYHPGLAVFHEGSKYWGCCKPRAAEFEEFLKIEGCKMGRHKFLPKAGEGPTSDQVKCRYDFYQQNDTVIASIYGKNINKETSTISFGGKMMEVHLIFKDGRKFDKSFELSGPIDPSQCSHEFLTTKVEIKLIKTTPPLWEKLDIHDEQVGTFTGITQGV